jgi:4-amino-4-deoxy-L-arabinose transferase-like glycosyltransferase
LDAGNIFWLKIRLSTTTDRISAPEAPSSPVPAQVLPDRRFSVARARLRDVIWPYGALAVILALSAVLNAYRLGQNGFANTYYSAAVRSMVGSLHNFVFASFDPGGLVSIDKTPLAVWVQVAASRLFGFSALGVLLPEAIISTVAVAVLYWLLARRLGAGAALMGALALAVFPSFVAISRDNGVDPLLILLMLLACAMALNAIETGRWRWLVAMAALVALAFNTKALAAYLVLPRIVVAYLLCAPGSPRRRMAMLSVAALITLIGSFSWIALVEITPSTHRPYVGDTTDNSELGLTFGYNGLGRVRGEVGAPGQVPKASVPMQRQRSHLSSEPATGHPRTRIRPPIMLPNGRLRNPITRSGATGPLRLFDRNLADEGAWTLPFALLGMLAFALLIKGDRRGRGDPRLALLLVLGGWLLCEVVVLSFSSGIVHPYYTSALAPGAAAMLAAAAVAFTRFAQRRDWRVVLPLCAVVATVVVQITILHDQAYMQWWMPVLIAGATVALAALAMRRRAEMVMAALLALLLVAPAADAITTWSAPGHGTFPAAGPHQAAASGEYGIDPTALRVDRSLIAYVNRHHPGRRWAVLTEAAPTAAPLILLGSPAAAMGGYSGTDPVLDGPGLARLVARGWARYVLLGGFYASRGGNRATNAVLRACAKVPARAWRARVRPATAWSCSTAAVTSRRSGSYDRFVRSLPGARARSSGRTASFIRLVRWARWELAEVLPAGAPGAQLRSVSVINSAAP